MTAHDQIKIAELLASIVGIWLAGGVALALLSERTGRRFFALMFFWPLLIACFVWKERSRK
jgi:hypothetical protein